MNWQEFGRFRSRFNEHDIPGRAAQLSYYFLLALFPFLLFLVTLLGYFAQAGSQLRVTLLSYLAAVMPRSAVLLVHNTLDEISSGRGSGKLSFGLLAALWAGSTGMVALSNTLNIAYRVEETRSWWKVRLISLFLTVTLSSLILLALALVFYGAKIVAVLPAMPKPGGASQSVWSILQWTIVLAFLLAAFSLIYRFAPNLEPASRRWITPGAFVAIVLWLLISFGFRLYLHFFDSYSLTYGSLGALIILMLWFYLTGLAILVGGEINSQFLTVIDTKNSS